MRMTRGFLLPLTLLFGASMTSWAGLPSLDQVYKLIKSFQPKNELSMTLLDNGCSKDPITITVIDRLAPVGHALVFDVENGKLIQDLTSSGDSFELPPLSKVGLYFIPTGKAIGLTFRIQIGKDASASMEFNLKKQSVVKLKADPIWKVTKETPRIVFNKDAFENAEKGACWTSLDAQ